jgi:chemotaxis protein CheD
MVALGSAYGVAPMQRDLVTVGISDYAICGEPEAVIITYSLGSCVGVTFHDPHVGLGAMVHCLLPAASRDMRQRGIANPFMFVDTAVARVLAAMYERGADPRNLVIKVAGGASPIDDHRNLRIGDHNVEILYRLLEKNGLPVSASEVGGRMPRTMRLYVGEGRTTVTIHGRERDL